ncbi:UNVERIFIED_ASMBLY: hypothetical protein SD1_37 [Shigella phage 2019SD1]|uniref:Uncharacterized protein n=1 Tax=Shigella phage 2019SD1 TaxID=2848074 RepID=A0A6M5CCP2_9CAUD|nr:hypothetical protein H1N84_gp37 [Shigella phage 2019SD1]
MSFEETRKLPLENGMSRSVKTCKSFTNPRQNSTFVKTPGLVSGIIISSKRTRGKQNGCLRSTRF